MVVLKRTVEVEKVSQYFGQSVLNVLRRNIFVFVFNAFVEWQMLHFDEQIVNFCSIFANRFKRNYSLGISECIEYTLLLYARKVASYVFMHYYMRMKNKSMNNIL